MEIGQRIAERRKELHMTQEELAGRLGYRSKSSINKIELGINDVPQRRLAAFAEALDTTVGFLMGLEDPVPEDPVPPEITMIARAGSKMTPERRADMLKMLQIAFPEAFGDD